jgi:hypothetical protein
LRRRACLVFARIILSSVLFAFVILAFVLPQLLLSQLLFSLIQFVLFAQLVFDTIVRAQLRLDLLRPIRIYAPVLQPWQHAPANNSAASLKHAARVRPTCALRDSWPFASIFHRPAQCSYHAARTTDASHACTTAGGADLDGHSRIDSQRLQFDVLLADQLIHARLDHHVAASRATANARD